MLPVVGCVRGCGIGGVIGVVEVGVDCEALDFVLDAG
jgi:hypothetical protein